MGTHVALQPSPTGLSVDPYIDGANCFLGSVTGCLCEDCGVPVHPSLPCSAQELKAPNEHPLITPCDKLGTPSVPAACRVGVSPQHCLQASLLPLSAQSRTTSSPSTHSQRGKHFRGLRAECLQDLTCWRKDKDKTPARCCARPGRVRCWLGSPARPLVAHRPSAEPAG